MPEERLGYPTVGTAWHALTTEQRREAFMREIDAGAAILATRLAA